MEKGSKKVHKPISVKTNINERENKVNELNEIMKEASILIKELASMNVELELDV